MGLITPNLGPDFDTLRTDFAAEVLRNVLKDGWSVLSLSGGVADAFTDQTGISALGGATYAANSISNPGTQTVIAGGTAFGTLTGYGGVAAAFDGVTAQAAAASAGLSGGATVNGYGNTVGKVFAAPTVVTRITLTSPTDCGFRNTSSGPIKVSASPDTTTGADGTWADIWTGTQSGATGQVIDITSGIPATAYKGVRVDVSGNASNAIGVAEMALYQTNAPPAVATVSAVFTPAAAVSTLRLVSLLEEGGCVLGTDALFDVTATGAWAAMPLSDLGKYDSLTRIVGGVVTVPAGSAVQWRWRTTTAAAQKLHGVYLQWK